MQNISRDWEKIYNHPLYFLETFVDTERFSGTCYKAANWIHVGDTTGRGKNEKKGHGKIPASDYTGADREFIPHGELKPKDSCPLCPNGKVYPIKKPVY